MNHPAFEIVSYSQLQIGGEVTNARKKFNVEKMRELKSSIREHGVRQPLEVVMLWEDKEGGEHQYGIVTGSRRHRATGELLQDLRGEIEGAQDEAALASLQELVKARMQMPVRVLTAEEVPRAQELNLVENLNRDDLSAAEEADGYAELMTRDNPDTGAKYRIEEVAQKVGKEASYISRRLKLRKAPRVLLDAIDEGMVAATIGELVGKIPDEKAREEVAKLILKPKAPAPEQEVPLNFLQTKQLIRESFMIRIDKGCGFDSSDAELVPAKLEEGTGVRLCGGACDDCPMRSGMNEDLQEELATANKGKGKSSGIDPNLCTFPSCFREKQDAAWKVTRRHAEQAGNKVIEGSSAMKLFSGDNGGLAYDAKYRRGSEETRGHDMGVNWDSPAYDMKLEKLAVGLDVPKVIARNPHTGKVETLLDKKAIIDEAKKKKPDLFKRSSSSGSGGSGGKSAEDAAHDRKIELFEQKVSAATDREAANALVEKISKTGVGLEEQMILFEIALQDAGADGQHFMGKWLEIKKDKKGGGGSGRDYGAGILEHVKAKGTTLQALQAFTVLAMIAQGMKWSGRRSSKFQALAKVYGVDVKQVEKDVKVMMASQRPKKKDAAGAAKKKEKAPKKAPGKKVKEAPAPKAPRAFDDSAMQAKWEEVVAVAMAADCAGSQEIEQWLEGVADTYDLLHLDEMKTVHDLERLLEKATLEKVAWDKGVERCDVCAVPLAEGAPEGGPHVGTCCGGEFAVLEVSPAAMPEGGKTAKEKAKASKKAAKKAA